MYENQPIGIIDRKEAGEIAFKSGQTEKIKEQLFSEDLY